jgi:biopolymer transport protein ExbD
MAFSSNSGGGTDKPMADINTTPLVDVMLVLLIIFMITAPLMSSKVKIELPKATYKPADEKELAKFTVNVKDTGNGRYDIYWEDDPVQLDGFITRLKAEALKNPQPQMKLRADRSLQFKAISEVLGLAKDIGIQKVGVVSNPQ